MNILIKLMSIVSLVIAPTLAEIYTTGKTADETTRTEAITNGITYQNQIAYTVQEKDVPGYQAPVVSIVRKQMQASQDPDNSILQTFPDLKSRQSTAYKQFIKTTTFKQFINPPDLEITFLNPILAP